MAKFALYLNQREFMAHSKNKPKLSKRQALREERKRREQRKRLFTILAIIGAAIIIIGLVLIPTIQTSRAPVGEFVQITPAVIPLAEGTAIGDPDSPIKVEVFEDFKCKACKSYSEVFEPQVIENHASKGEIYYVIYNYPFLDDQNPVKDSDRAAYASECAAEQNRFWDYHKLIYANLNFVPNEFSEKRLTAFAESLGLDMEAFSSCMDSTDVKTIINNNLARGSQMGVTGTPSVFVNGTDIKPGMVPTYEDIQAAIEQAKSNTRG